MRKTFSRITTVVAIHHREVLVTGLGNKLEQFLKGSGSSDSISIRRSLFRVYLRPFYFRPPASDVQQIEIGPTCHARLQRSIDEHAAQQSHPENLLRSSQIFEGGTMTTLLQRMQDDMKLRNLAA